MPVMTIGQVAEIATMALLAIVLKRLGWRVTMIIGVLGHAVRFGVFALFPEAVPAILVNVLHGICYAFFFATVYIFIDERYPKDIGASAQGLFNFLILGAGPFVGTFVWLGLQDAFTQDKVVDYQALFLFPSATALFAAVLLLLFFHPPAAPVAGKEREQLDAAGWKKDTNGPGIGLVSEGPRSHGIQEEQGGPLAPP
jgi:MFS family permease